MVALRDTEIKDDEEEVETGSGLVPGTRTC